MLDEEKKKLEVLHNNFLDMFRSKGWTQFQEAINQDLNNLTNTASAQCGTNDLWQFRRGQLDILTRITEFENFRNAIFKHTMEEHGDLDEDYI